MSVSSKRGTDFERKVGKITAKILKLEVKRDSRSGAGETHKADVRDRFNETGLFIECKNQEKANIKADWRKADAQSSVGESAVVVFPDNEVILATIRYDDLLQIIAERNDWRKLAEDYRLSKAGVGSPPPLDLVKQAVKKKVSNGGIHLCGNGHITDQYGFCMQKGCKYSRGYKKPKEKK